MRARVPVAVAALALLAPAVAQAQPNTFVLSSSVRPHNGATLAIGTVPKGEFSFVIRVGSDGVKDFLLTQQRNGGTRFTVFDSRDTTQSATCGAAAGTIQCSGITTPATPAGKHWAFTFRNRSGRPMQLKLTIRWRPVMSAG